MAEAVAVGTVGAVGTLAVGLAATLGATLTPAGVLFLAALPLSALVDHGSGASYVYPSVIGILMPPAEFPDEVSRAAYFESLERARRDAHALRRNFDEAFCAAEPHPLCAFLSGNFVEWCQQPREACRGIGEVLQARNLPIWASCGGAQGLAILQETGVDRPWDCPRCRDPGNPKSPVYSHIGHTGPSPCGDYSKCVAERGRYKMQLVARDPSFRGLPGSFEVMESHVGQIAYVPAGWLRVVTRGPGALTENQCLRLKDRYVYAAQFHIEMAGALFRSCKFCSKDYLFCYPVNREVSGYSN